MTTDAHLAKAREFCETKGARFTHLREKVYELLLEKPILWVRMSCSMN